VSLRKAQGWIATEAPKASPLLAARNDKTEASVG